MEESRTAIQVLCDALQSLSVASLGLFAGAMLTEGSVLVPYWRSLRPEAFFAWYAANDRRLLGFFGPLTSVTALMAVAAAVASWWVREPGRWASLAAGILTVAVVLTFPLYFQRANARFAAATIHAEDLSTELARWAAWHRVRTAASFAALAAALLSL
jgi:uncharacterized membrane protein